MHPARKKKMTGRTKAALWCLIGPTGLLVAAFIIFAALNWIFGGPTQPINDDLFEPTSIGLTIANIILFILGNLAIVTWLPGLVIGIVLLATAPQRK